MSGYDGYGGAAVPTMMPRSFILYQEVSDQLRLMSGDSVDSPTLLSHQEPRGSGVLYRNEAQLWAPQPILQR